MKIRVQDVAEYILRELGPIPAMKLQKLVYYCQAWSLVWEERPIYEDRIEAWANGPVVPSLYAAHRGQHRVTTVGGNASVLPPEDRETVDAIIHYYGDKSSQWLSNVTHQEAPWKSARKNLLPGERSSEEITHASMDEYYGSLV